MVNAYSQASQVLAQVVAGGSVLLDMRTGVLFNLNKTGARIWGLLATYLTPEGVSARLAAEHPSVPCEVVERDVRALMAELARRDLIVARPEPLPEIG